MYICSMKTEIQENELSIKQYAAKYNMTTQAVYARRNMKKRYLIEETQEFLVVQDDLCVRNKPGRKKGNDSKI